jgi:hypothetical protein
MKETTKSMDSTIGVAQTRQGWSERQTDSPFSPRRIAWWFDCVGMTQANISDHVEARRVPMMGTVIYRLGWNLSLASKSKQGKTNHETSSGGTSPGRRSANVAFAAARHVGMGQLRKWTHGQKTREHENRDAHRKIADQNGVRVKMQEVAQRHWSSFKTSSATEMATAPPTRNSGMIGRFVTGFAACGNAFHGVIVISGDLGDNPLAADGATDGATDGKGAAAEGA